MNEATTTKTEDLLCATCGDPLWKHTRDERASCEAARFREPDATAIVCARGDGCQRVEIVRADDVEERELE